MPSDRSIVIIGSINIDLVSRAAHLPARGETVLGTTFALLPGGKGANQAVAAARLGGRVRMIGRVGDDSFGATLREGLSADGVDVAHVRVTKGVPSGCATILVDERGENSIVVVPGANAALTPADVDAAADCIASASVVVMQLEVPRETVRHASALCRRSGVFNILDPAPVPGGGLPGALFDVDLLTPNQTEAAQLLGLASDAAPQRIAQLLLARGPRSVVLKRGAGGAMLADASGVHRVTAFPVKVVDTTAAGDAFTGALAVAQAEGMSAIDAVRFACAAGALCCQTLGAQPAMPTRLAVEGLMKR